MIDSLTDHYLICGFGRVGRQVARDLRAAGAKYVVIDPDPENRERAQAAGVRFLEGLASEDELLRSAGIERARGIVACVDSDAENIVITLSARELRARHQDHRPRERRGLREEASARGGRPRDLALQDLAARRWPGSRCTRNVSGAVELAPEYRMEEIEVDLGLPGQRLHDRRDPGRGDRSSALHPSPTATSSPSRRPRPCWPPATCSWPWARERTMSRLEALFDARRRGRPAAMNPLADLRAAVEAAAAAGCAARAAPRALRPTLERPPKAEFGDYSTNAAMLLAPALGEPPRAIAERLGDELRGAPGGGLDRVEVAGPGLPQPVPADAWFRDALAHVLDGRRALRRGHGRDGPSGCWSSSSAPTRPGPLTAAGGPPRRLRRRAGAVLELAGHDVEREYYVNDFGSQVQRLGESIRARARGEDVPEDGYEGDYVAELAEQIPGAADARPRRRSRARGVELMLESIRATLHRFRVDFDTWFSERSLHDGATAVERASPRSSSDGHDLPHEGALWLRSSTFGDDKDRVLERSSGEHTYFASDIAYHEHKRARGFDRLIDVWGADHHGYVARMKAAFAGARRRPGRARAR